MRFFIFFSLFSVFCFGEKTKKNYDLLGFALRLGSPTLLSGEASYSTGAKYVFGGTFGYFPTTLYPGKITLNSVELNPVTTVNPNLEFSLTAWSLFFRYFFLAHQLTGFYTEIMYSSWTGTAAFKGDITNTVLQTTSKNALTGTSQISHQNATLLLGIQFKSKIGIFLNTSLGISAFLTPKISTKLKGNLNDLSDDIISGLGENTLNSTLNSLEKDVTLQTEKILNKYKLLPALSISLGWYF